MTQERGLTVGQTEVGIFLQPDIVLENARTAARALTSVISQKTKPVIMNGEQYLEFDDWQLAGQFYGYTVKTGGAEPVEIDGVKGAKAHADLIDKSTGMVIGGAEAFCMRDEEHWNTRPKYEWQGEGDNRKRIKVANEVVPWFQLASMAQTRAGAKAFRNRLAWVVVLAGYKPTPAEEMIEGTVSEAVQQRRTVDKTEHYCELHGVKFFKTQNMRAYAHPVKNADGSPALDDNDKPRWCSETIEKTQPKAQSQATTITSEGQAREGIEEIKGIDAPVEVKRQSEKSSKVDPDQLKEMLKKLGWTNLQAVAWLVSRFNVPRGKSLTEVLANLTGEQYEQFVNELSKRTASIPF